MLAKSGPRILSKEPLPRNPSFALGAHLPYPDRKLITKRFETGVSGVCHGPSYELALRSVGRVDFVRGKEAGFGEGSQLVRTNGNTGELVKGPLTGVFLLGFDS